MPLPYEVHEALQVSTSSFNDDGLAVLMVHGGRYGGDWEINARLSSDDPSREPRGSIGTSRGRTSTKDERYPDLALDSAFVWLNDEAKKRGWRLVHWESLNDNFPSDQKPYFVLARALLANERFVPAEGVIYADEIPR